MLFTAPVPTPGIKAKEYSYQSGGSISHSPEEMGLMSYWNPLSSDVIKQIDNVFNKHIDETGQRVVNNYEQAYPYLTAASKVKQKK